MNVRISLTLEASEMFLSLHMIFSLERAAVVWAILERISGFDPSLEMIAPRYLKFSTSYLLTFYLDLLPLTFYLDLLPLTYLPLTFYLDLSLEAIRVVCHHFCLVWTDLHFVPCGGSVKTVYQDASLFFFFCIYDNVICKAEGLRGLTLCKLRGLTLCKLSNLEQQFFLHTRSGYFRLTRGGIRRPRAWRQDVVDRSRTEHLYLF